MFYILISIGLFTACTSDFFGISGKGNIVTDETATTEFQKVELRSNANISIEKIDTSVYKTDTFIVDISDYENIIKYISAKVVSKNLIITVDPISTILMNSKADVRILIPDSLTTLILTGSGNMTLNTAFKDLNTIYSSGSGNVTVNEGVNLNELNAYISGPGNINISGNVKNLYAYITGSGNMNLPQLSADVASCLITGSGNIYVTANDTLKGEITGSGNIEYYGSPVVLYSLTGSGKIIQK